MLLVTEAIKVKRKLLKKSETVQTVTLSPADNHRLASFCGQADQHIHMIEDRFGVTIKQRDVFVHISGEPKAVALAVKAVETLYAETELAQELSPESVHLCLQVIQSTSVGSALPIDFQSISQEVSIRTKAGNIKARGENQAVYLENVAKHDINFGIGPSGTGKTYLAVACAVDALQRNEVTRIVLVRPAVEAGESLGFLPGDLADKVDPYLRPLYDALYEMLGFENVSKLIEQHVIELAPLAFMRGRTLNNAFIILDESQNTTVEQMKMFLTRIGFQSKVVVTGDVTQIDLPKGKMSGLRHVIKVLKDVEGISFSRFEAKDVVRHTLVQRIVEAYEKFERPQDDGFGDD